MGSMESRSPARSGLTCPHTNPDWPWLASNCGMSLAAVVVTAMRISASAFCSGQLVFSDCSNKLRRYNPFNPSDGLGYVLVLWYPTSVEDQIRNLASPVALVAQGFVDRPTLFSTWLEVWRNHQAEHLGLLQLRLRIFPEVPPYCEVGEPRHCFLSPCVD